MFYSWLLQYSLGFIIIECVVFFWFKVGGNATWEIICEVLCWPHMVLKVIAYGCNGQCQVIFPFISLTLCLSAFPCLSVHLESQFPCSSTYKTASHMSHCHFPFPFHMFATFKFDRWPQPCAAQPQSAIFKNT